MPTPLDRDALLSAFDAAQARLEADPIFGHDANAPFAAGEVRALLKSAPGTFEALFGETLQGMIQSVRYAGLVAVAGLSADAGANFEVERLEAGDDDVVFYPGDLSVAGDAENGGIVVAAGDLRIGGSYLGAALGYSLLAAGGTLTLCHAMTAGEILAGDGLNASGLVYLHHNDYSCVLPRVRARALAQDDHYDAIGVLDVAEHQRAFPDEPLLARLFGEHAVIPAGDDPYEALWAMMTSPA
jgi:hypothetical protein